MVKQEDFAVEQFMDRYETGIKHNLGETCCYSMSIEEVSKLVEGSETLEGSSIAKDILTSRLTYGHIRGSPELKSTIANGLYEGTGLKEENIAITNGAIGANFLTFYTIVDKDDHVVVVDPSYQQLSSVPKMFGGKVDLFKLRFEDNYLPDLEKLQEVISANKTKLLVINNPHNPTGVVWEDKIIEQVVAICKQNDTYILCDEVYRPLYHGKAAKSILSYGYEKSVSTSSMSKAFSLAGIRLGWVATHDPKLRERLFSKRDYNTISVSIVDDLLASYALKNYKKILQRNYDLCQVNLKVIDKYIEQSKGALKWVRPQGGSTCFIKVTNDKINTYEMCAELAEKHSVLVVPGEVFGHPGFLRVGFGNSTEELEGGLPIVLEYLATKQQ